MEYLVVIAIVAAAMVFSTWRVLKTLDVARGGEDKGGCHTCPANKQQ